MSTRARRDLVQDRRSGSSWSCRSRRSCSGSSAGSRPSCRTARVPTASARSALFQAIADAAKFIFKEDFEPARRRSRALPPGADAGAGPGDDHLPRDPVRSDDRGRRAQKIASVVIDSDSGVFIFLALASLGVYSLVLAGYSSNNKWSLLGSIRASAQMISYELALTLAVVAALIPAGSLDLRRWSTTRSRTGSSTCCPPGAMLRPASRLPRLPGRHVRRDQPAAVRPRRGRVRAGRRLPHRVRLDPLRALLHERVHVDGRPLGSGRDALLRRLVAARARPLALLGVLAGGRSA